jgi:hypothetical protein
MGARFTLILLLLGNLLLGGCAAQRVPLPFVTPDQLPDAWLDVLAAEPCPDPFRARVRMRLSAPNQPSVRLDGTLLADVPDHIRLSGKLGVFRPIFNLFAVPDSCEMLIHDDSTYWITARDQADWAAMNPSAWGTVLEWALCPQGLLRRFVPEEAGRVDGREWTVSGRLQDTPFRAELVFDRKDRRLLSIVLRDWDGAESGPVAVSARLRDHEAIGTRLLPTLLEFVLPHPDGTLNLTVEIAGLSSLGLDELVGKGLVRPPGWTAVGKTP